MKPFKSHVISDTETIHSCNHCNENFKKKRDMIIHARQHQGKKTFECTQCYRWFSKQRILTDHLRTHIDDKSYICSKCNNGFRKITTLFMHQRMKHPNEKPDIIECKTIDTSLRKTHTILKLNKTVIHPKTYSCKYCNKIYTSQNQLGIHLRKHTGERPFSCNECGKSYMRVAEIKRHMKLHTGEKPFSCKVCKMSFEVKLNLNNHLKTGLCKPSTCYLCDKDLNNNDDLMLHLANHTDLTSHTGDNLMKTLLDIVLNH